jgi:hypothetical protein
MQWRKMGKNKIHSLMYSTENQNMMALLERFNDVIRIICMIEVSLLVKL